VSSSCCFDHFLRHQGFPEAQHEALSLIVSYDTVPKEDVIHLRSHEGLQFFVRPLQKRGVPAHEEVLYEVVSFRK